MSIVPYSGPRTIIVTCCRCGKTLRRTDDGSIPAWKLPPGWKQLPSDHDLFGNYDCCPECWAKDHPQQDGWH